MTMAIRKISGILDDFKEEFRQLAIPESNGEITGFFRPNRPPPLSVLERRTTSISSTNSAQTSGSTSSSTKSPIEILQERRRQIFSQSTPPPSAVRLKLTSPKTAPIRATQPGVNNNNSKLKRSSAGNCKNEYSYIFDLMPSTLSTSPQYLTIDRPSFLSNQAHEMTTIDLAGRPLAARSRSSTMSESFNKLLRKSFRRRSRNSSSSRRPSQSTTISTGVSSPASGSFLSLYNNSHMERPCERHLIMVIGDAMTGKSTLIDRLLENWQHSHQLENTDIFSRSITLQSLGAPTILSLLEVNPETNDLWPSMSVAGFMVVYAVSDWRSFKSAECCVRTIYECDNNTPIWLVGTMLDAQRRVDVAAIELLTKKFGAVNFELCAKTNSLDINLQKLASNIAVNYTLKNTISRVHKIRLEDNNGMPKRKISQSMDNLKVLAR